MVKNFFDTEIIDALGGPKVLAEKLGDGSVRGIQRVRNWYKRGIPASIKLEYPELFLVTDPKFQKLINSKQSKC